MPRQHDWNLLINWRGQTITFAVLISSSMRSRKGSTAPPCNACKTSTPEPAPSTSTRGRTDGRLVESIETRVGELGLHFVGIRAELSGLLREIGIEARAVGRELREKYGVREIRMFAKGYFGTPVEESVVQQMLQNCDFAVAALPLVTESSR